MPLENLHLLGDISKSVKGHHGSDNAARSLCRHGSVDEKENSFAEYPLSNAVVQPASEQKTKDVRPSLVKVDRGLLCGGDVDDLNPLISYGRHGNTVGMPIQVWLLIYITRNYYECPFCLLCIIQSLILTVCFFLHIKGVNNHCLFCMSVIVVSVDWVQGDTSFFARPMKTSYCVHASSKVK